MLDQHGATRRTRSRANPLAGAFPLPAFSTHRRTPLLQLPSFLSRSLKLSWRTGTPSNYSGLLLLFVQLIADSTPATASRMSIRSALLRRACLSYPNAPLPCMTRHATPLEIAKRLHLAKGGALFRGNLVLFARGKRDFPLYPPPHLRRLHASSFTQRRCCWCWCCCCWCGHGRPCRPPLRAASRRE